MSGGGYYSVPSKEDLKNEAYKYPYLLWPAAVLCAIVVGLFVLLLLGFAAFILTEDTHYLARYANLLGKGFAVGVVIFTYLIVAGIVTLWREW